MSKLTITILSAAAFIGGFLIFYQNRSVEQRTPIATNNASQRLGTVQKWETKTDDQANVTVVVTPLDLSAPPTLWKFDVGMNTHLVELDQDMLKIAVLIDDQGKEYKPINWDGPIGGHHREGVLTFSPITPIPQSIELKIRDIGGIPERTFQWSLAE